MRIVTISDTHGQHENIQLPQGDILIHAGDCSKRGKKIEIDSFLDWFEKQTFEYKILIAGNHDFFFEEKTNAEIQAMLPSNTYYLNDSGITINNINFWGSPITPWFFSWAFNRHRGEEIAKHWALIPNDTHVLITHGPAYNRLDIITNGTKVGCKDLLLKLNTLSHLKYHICGHIHEAYGMIEKEALHFINASVLDEDYNIKNAPIIFEI